MQYSLVCLLVLLLGATELAWSQQYFPAKLPMALTDDESNQGGSSNLAEPATYSINSEMQIDCVWINAHDYFALWASNRVNPYRLDGAKFKDTIQLKLYNPAIDSSAVLPVKNTYITSPFGSRTYRWHYGADLKVQHGDPVGAAFQGIVRMVAYERYGYGHYIMVRHKNGLETLYGHLSKSKVKIGQEVKAGETIGLGGSTGRSSGNHLHFEVRYQGNAIDPTTMYDFENEMILCDQLLISPITFKYLKDANKIVYHRIRKGNTLSGIASRYRVSINQICRLNRINRKTILKIGRTLRIK